MRDLTNTMTRSDVHADVRDGADWVLVLRADRERVYIRGAAANAGKAKAGEAAAEEALR